MRIFKYKIFHKWAESEGLKDKALRQAVEELKNGLFEANLGSGLYKKRVAMPGKGKSGGYRTLLAFKNEEKAFFIYGFAKNDRANIDEHEKQVYRQLARDFLGMNTIAIQKMLDNGKLFEVQ